MSVEIQVCADWDGLGGPRSMGILRATESRGKELFSFSYDDDWLRSHREFDFGSVRSAILATFERRSSSLPSDIPIALTAEFANDPTKVTQWSAFLRKNQLDVDSFDEVVEPRHGFLMPLLREVAESPTIWSSPPKVGRRLPVTPQ